MAADDRARNADLQEALQEVRRLIEDVVRKEQLRNDLTQLPNDHALDAFLRDSLEKNTKVWCALVEVDRFKRLNKKFSFEAADGMLRAIADELRGSERKFPVGTRAFHAHGDEFYLAGPEPEQPHHADIEEALKVVRASVGCLKIPAEGFQESMSVTVTIGWVLQSDLDASHTEDVVTPRRIRVATELAVATGKRDGRDRVAKHDDSMSSMDVVEDRDDCPACGASFTVDVARQELKDGTHWYCPNCAGEVPRDVAPSTLTKPQPV